MSSDPFEALRRLNAQSYEPAKLSVDMSFALNELKTGSIARGSLTQNVSDIHSVSSTIEDLEYTRKARQEVIDAKKTTVPSEDEFDELSECFLRHKLAQVDYQQFIAIAGTLPLKARNYCNNSHFFKSIIDNHGTVSVAFLLSVVKRHIDVARISVDMLSYSIHASEADADVDFNSLVYIREKELEQYIYDTITSFPAINDCLTEDFKPFYVFIVVGLFVFHNANALYLKEMSIKKLVSSHIFSEWIKFCHQSEEYLLDSDEEEDDDQDQGERRQKAYRQSLDAFKYDTENNPFSVHKAYKIYDCYMCLDLDNDGVLGLYDFYRFNGFGTVEPLTKPSASAAKTSEAQEQSQGQVRKQKKKKTVVEKILDESLTTSLLVQQARAPSNATINTNSPAAEILLTNVFVDQLFACGHIAYPAVGMDYKEFLQFYFAFKYKKHIASYHYFWRILMSAKYSHTLTGTYVPDPTAVTHLSRKRLTPEIIRFFYRDVVDKFPEVFGTHDKDGYPNAPPPPADQIISEIYDVISYSIDPSMASSVSNSNTASDSSGFGAAASTILSTNYGSAPDLLRSTAVGPNFTEFCSGNLCSNNNKAHQGYVVIHMLIDLISYKNYEDREYIFQQEQQQDSLLEDPDDDTPVDPNGGTDELPKMDSLRSTQYNAICMRRYKPVPLPPAADN